MCYERIRDLREDHDLYQKDLANYLHCSQVAYSHYELETEIFQPAFSFSWHTSIIPALIIYWDKPMKSSPIPENNNHNEKATCYCKPLFLYAIMPSNLYILMYPLIFYLSCLA